MENAFGAGPKKRCKYAAFEKIRIACDPIAVERCYFSGVYWGAAARNGRLLGLPVVHVKNTMPSKLRPAASALNPQTMLRLIVALAASVTLSACMSSSPFSSPPTAPSSSQDQPGPESAPAPSGLGQRELTPAEKKIIANAIAPSIRDAAAAQYRWPKIQNVPDGPVNYCGMVNAKSPYAAYSGRQAFIVSATVAGGKVSSAAVGLIAGGKDIEIVRNMCKKYDLDPGAG